MKAKRFLLSLTVMSMSLGLFTACNNNKPKAPEAAEKLVMTAPRLTADERGLIDLRQCPITDPHLTVMVSEDITAATISYDGKEIQTLTDEDGLATDEATVRFLDANFDGLTDIFIGAGASRTYSALLLWNADEQQFHRVGTLGAPDLQGFKFCPGDKKIIEGGSGSYCSFYITQNHWNGDELVLDEQLVIISDPGEYIPYGVKNKYTIQDGNEKELCSVENKESLPEFWQAVLKAYDME